MRPTRRVLAVAAIVLLASGLQGCVVFRTAGKIVGTAVKTTGKVVGAAVDAAT